MSLIRELDELVSPGTVIATNTSPIPIAELAGKVWHPGQVAGVHFFSHVPVMKLVEIIVAPDTHPQTADIVFAFAEKLGKHPIRAKDRSGFIVNFLLVGYLMAAIRMFEEGLASREDIDEGMHGSRHRSPDGPADLGRYGRPRHGLLRRQFDVRGVQARGVRAAAVAQADDRRRPARPEVRTRFYEYDK